MSRSGPFCYPASVERAQARAGGAGHWPRVGMAFIIGLISSVDGGPM